MEVCLGPKEYLEEIQLGWLGHKVRVVRATPHLAIHLKALGSNSHSSLCHRPKVTRCKDSRPKVIRPKGTHLRDITKGMEDKCPSNLPGKNPKKVESKVSSVILWLNRRGEVILIIPTKDIALLFFAGFMG